jgi:ELWxxDGT repeat protein
LFFTAFGGREGVELWQSNATSTGTKLIADIQPGSNSSSPFNLTNVGGTLFFVANDGGHGYELFKSNGTSTGTVLVNDIFPGSHGSFPDYLTNVNGTLFFAANDGTYGLELWQSNGTSAGTVLLGEINPGSAGSNPRYLANVSGQLFFSANDGTYGYELWDLPVGGPAPAASNPGKVPGSPAPPAPPAVAPASGTNAAAPSSTSRLGKQWELALWLEAMLVVRDAGAAGEEMPWLALLHSLPGGESTQALDLLLAGLAHGNTG